MIIRTPRVQTPDTRQRLLVGRITRLNGRVHRQEVTAERYTSLGFSLLTRAQLDARLAQAHSA